MAAIGEICAICHLPFHGNARPFECDECSSKSHRRCVNSAGSPKHKPGDRFVCSNCKSETNRRLQVIRPPSRTRIPTENPRLRHELGSRLTEASIVKTSSSFARLPEVSIPIDSSDEEPTSTLEESSTSEIKSDSIRASSSSLDSDDVVREPIQLSMLKTMMTGVRENFLTASIVFVIILLAFFGLLALFFLGHLNHPGPSANLTERYYHPKGDQQVTFSTPLLTTQRLQISRLSGRIDSPLTRVGEFSTTTVADALTSQTAKTESHPQSIEEKSASMFEIGQDQTTGPSTAIHISLQGFSCVQKSTMLICSDAARRMCIISSQRLQEATGFNVCAIPIKSPLSFPSELARSEFLTKCESFDVLEIVSE